MSTALLPTRTLRRAGPPEMVSDWPGLQIDDHRLRDVLSPEAPLLKLHEDMMHAEGTTWDPPRDRLIWSDVPGRRVLGWHADGRVEVVIDATWFINGNAVTADGVLLHCEHGRRCISRGGGDGAQPEPIVSHFKGRRLNSPNDLTIAADGAIWFTDPVFGIVLPSQGALAEPELDHRSVYRFDPASGDLARMADLDQPNGLAFSPDGATLYVSDTSRSLGGAPGLSAGPTHEVVAFDLGADGALSNRRFFCHTDHGVPDGLAVDRRGWLWVSAGDGAHIWSPDAHRLGFIPTPDVVSNLAFGGADGRRLFMAATKYLLAIDLIA